MENQQQHTAQPQDGQIEQNREGNRFEEAPPEYLARVRAAFNGKDGRRVLHTIKNQFPHTRTAALNMKLVMMQDGLLMDEDILTAVESVSID